MGTPPEYSEIPDTRLESLSNRITNLKMQCQTYLHEGSLASSLPISDSTITSLNSDEGVPWTSSSLHTDLRSISPCPSYINVQSPSTRNSEHTSSANLLMPSDANTVPSLYSPINERNLIPPKPYSAAVSPVDVQLGASHHYYSSSSDLTQTETRNASSSYLNNSQSYSVLVNDRPPPYYSPHSNKSVGDISPLDITQKDNNYSESFINVGENGALPTNPSNLSLPNQYLSKSSENLLDSRGQSTVGSVSPHFMGYYKETVEVLGPEEYRWFYKVDGDKKWTPFIGYDSLRIEWNFRDLLMNGLTSCAFEFPDEKSTNGDCEERPFELGEEGTVMVRGGMYEVDVKQRKGQSIYWKGEVFNICRGTWFYEGAWMPLEEHLAQKIETEHLSQFRGKLLDVPTPLDAQKKVVHRIAVPGGTVEWFSASEIYLALDHTPARLMRSVGKKLGFQKTGYKIHRGYSEDSCATDKPPDITHIVFVIHGIGQKMDTGRIIKNSTSLRENVNTMKQKYLREMYSSSRMSGDVNHPTTVEFFPVEWRSLLTLDDGLIECITPHKILNIRQMLNASFMDIMYYNSPQYREEVVTGLSGELNRLYSLFTGRNPYFEANGGQVSIIAHSLGCVITYDIITGWSPTPQLSTSFLQAMSGVLGSHLKDDTSQQVQAALHQLMCKQLQQAEQPNLNFKITNLFCLGSPLAVFLALRWKKSTGLPMKSKGRFQRILNIFHPSDPVAYRLEPLLSNAYSTIAPVTLHCHSASDKVPYPLLSFEPMPNKDTSSAQPNTDNLCDTPNSQPTTPVKAGGSSNNSNSWNLWGLMKGGKKGENSSDGSTNPLHSPHGGTTTASPHLSYNTEVELDCGRLSQSQRIDFVLREGSMESSYISALTSHTSYWSNLDVCHFLLTILYPHIKTCNGQTSVAHQSNGVNHVTTNASS